MTGTITQASPGLTGHHQVSHRSATLDVQVTQQPAKIFPLCLLFFLILKQMFLTGGNKFHSDPLSTALLHLDFILPVRHVLTGLNLLYLYSSLLPYASGSWEIHFLGLASSPTPAYIYLKIQLFYAPLNLCILL